MKFKELNIKMNLKSKLIFSFTGILLAFSGVMTWATYTKTNDLGDVVYKENIASVLNLSRTILDTTYKGEWSIKDNKLYKGNIDISGENELLDELKSQSGYYTTIFKGDTRIATNVIGTDGKRAIGTTAAPEVVNEVIKSGKEYVGEAQVVGIDTYVKYEPIKDSKGNIVGMLFSGVPKSTVKAKVSESLKFILAIIATSLTIGTIIAYKLGDSIVKRVKLVSGQLTKMADNDFTGEMPAFVLNSTDELGDMAHAAQVMTESVANVIKNIHTESDHINLLMEKTRVELEELKKQASGVSTATQNIAATTEETASSMTDISEVTKSVDKYVQDMSKNAEDGAKKAEAINQRALELKDSADTSQRLAIEILDENKAHIEEAIERAKNIREIELLSSTIAQISAKTTLLSLNASIEASRAGEAGRGFSVVANEIKALAEESQDAVSKIQETTKGVVSSVDELINSTNDIVEFLDVNVLADYEKLVETGDLYHSDAEFVQEFTNSLSKNAQQISTDINQINESIGGITVATNDNAKVVETIAYNSDTVTEKSTAVAGLAKETQDSVKVLQDTVSKFKIYKK